MMGVYVYEGETQNDSPVYVKRQGGQIHYLYRSKTGSKKWHITVGRI